MNPLDLKHQHFKYLWFDADFAYFHKLVKDLYDTIRGIERRFQHKESTQVAESVFNYVEKRDMLYYTPQVFHDYIDGDVRVCVASKVDSNKRGRYIRSFYIQLRGLSISKDDFAFLRRTYHARTSDGFTIGEFDTLEDAIDVFRWVIKFHLNTKLEMLFNVPCPNSIRRRDIVDIYGRPIPIPCGECLTCRIATRRQYEWRLKSEFVSKRSCFVTFTYDDYHLFYKDGFVKPSLNKVGIKKFMNKLHRMSPIPFTYFLSAEYGDMFGRPHYHCLFFGLDFVDHYNFFHHYWKNGSCKVLPILKGGIRYVLKYLDKQFPTKIEKQRDYIDVGLELPFRLASHGLGRDLLLSQIDTVRNFGCLQFGAKKITLSPYYRNKYLEYSDKYLDYYYDEDKKYRSELDYLAKLNGYQYTFDYVRDTAIARETSYVSKARQNLERCPDFVSVLKFVSNSDNKKLARFALEDLYE